MQKVFDYFDFAYLRKMKYKELFSIFYLGKNRVGGGSHLLRVGPVQPFCRHLVQRTSLSVFIDNHMSIQNHSVHIFKHYIFISKDCDVALNTILTKHSRSIQGLLLQIIEVFFMKSI